MRYVVGIVAGILLAAVASVGSTIAFARPGVPQPKWNAAAANLTRLPPISRYTARDGRDLAYRRYAGDPHRVVILIHGSAGSSRDMNALATALAAGKPDIRVVIVPGVGLEELVTTPAGTAAIVCDERVL